MNEKGKAKKYSGRKTYKDYKNKSTDKGNVEVKEKANDPSWYTVSDQLIRDVASLSFNTPLGREISINNECIGTFAAGTKIGLKQPGIMSIYTAPSCGYSIDSSSAINLAAKNFYTFIRHANSGHSNYDSPDLMIYLLAMDSLYSWYAWMTRIYGLARVFSQTNRYLGDAMLNAMGCSANIRKDLAGFRSFLNQFALKLSSFCVPKSMSLYSRHTWMYANVFKDENIDKSQFYAYVPAVLWQYRELEGAGRLHPIPVVCDQVPRRGISPRASLEYQDIVNISASLLNPIVDSEDMNIMSGDILKAYGDENVWKLALIPEDYTVFPMYSEEVLMQIHNTNFAGVATVGYTQDSLEDIDVLDVYQDTTIATGGRIYFTPAFFLNPYLGYEKILDINKQEVTPEDVIVASRNMLWGDTSTTDSGNARSELDVCGSEICLNLTITYINEAGVVNLMGAANNTSVDGTVSEMFRRLCSMFNMAPFLPDFGTAGSPGVNGMTGELTNFTIVNSKDIKRMHETALLSMFAVPKLGNMVK